MEERKNPVDLGIDDYLNETLADLYLELVSYDLTVCQECIEATQESGRNFIGNSPF